MGRIMKLLLHLIIFILFPSSLFSQPENIKLMDYINTFQNAKIASETKIHEVIDENQEVIDMLSPLNLKTGALNKYIESLPLNDFLDIIDKRTQAYEEDLFQPQEYWLKHDEKLSEKFAKDSIRFGVYEGILKRRLKELYGDAAAGLILSPILLKVKITSIKTEPYKLSDDESIGQIIINAEIQDVIKGSNHFSLGETIQFYYMPFWTYTDKAFSTNESYFVSLFAIIGNKTGERRFALDVNKVNSGITRISRDVLVDEENYYGFGRISWQEFKEKIFSSINIDLLKVE
jgi:hypothetical protein